MIIKNLNIYFFLGLLIFGTVAGFLLIKPYLSAIFIAALFAVLFMRPYEYLQKKIVSETASAAIMLVVVLITIILPVIFVLGLVSAEISGIVINGAQQHDPIHSASEKIAQSIVNMPGANIVIQQIEGYVSGPELANTIKTVANNSISIIQSTYRSIVNSVIGIFVMFFTLFYFFIDGKKFVARFMQLSPLRDVHERKLIQEFISMTRATLKGTVVIGFIQGILGGIAFAIAGVVSPILWTVIMIILGIIPAVGASLIIIPAAIIMWILGHVWQAIFLLIVSVFVSTIDNILRPKLVGTDTQMHSLAVFFATLGGLHLFGFIGFIVGPIVMALVLALWNIYALEFKKQLEKFNA